MDKQMRQGWAFMNRLFHAPTQNVMGSEVLSKRDRRLGGGSQRDRGVADRRHFAHPCWQELLFKSIQDTAALGFWLPIAWTDGASQMRAGYTQAFYLA